MSKAKHGWDILIIIYQVHDIKHMKYIKQLLYTPSIVYRLYSYIIIIIISAYVISLKHLICVRYLWIMITSISARKIILYYL